MLCIRNDGCEDLELRKLYLVLPDKSAAAEGYIRVIDESGEDYLYPENCFGGSNTKGCRESIVVRGLIRPHLFFGVFCWHFLGSGRRLSSLYLNLTLEPNAGFGGRIPVMIVRRVSMSAFSILMAVNWTITSHFRVLLRSGSTSSSNLSWS